MRMHVPQRGDGLKTPSRVFPAPRAPAEYRSLECRCEKHSDEWLVLTYSRQRGFFEPNPSRAAEAIASTVDDHDAWGPESRANLLFYAERIATLMRDPCK